MKKIIIRVAIVLVLLVVAALAVLFFSLNGIVKKGVETVGSKVTKVNVTLGAVDISPFSGSGRLTKFAVGNPEGYKTASAFQFGDVKVAIKIGSLFSDVVVIDEINIQAPEVTLEGTLDGKNNLSKLMDNMKSPAATPASNAPAAGPKKEKKLIVKKFVLDDAKGNVTINVPLLGPQSGTLKLKPVHLDNIGVAENGVTSSQLSQIIMKPILDDVIAQAEDFAKSSSKNIQSTLKDTNKVNSVIQGVSNLFKK